MQGRRASMALIANDPKATFSPRAQSASNSEDFDDSVS
jgi:hypothetical protein